jgi:hypothetical protein
MLVHMENIISRTMEIAMRCVKGFLVLSHFGRDKVAHVDHCPQVRDAIRDQHARSKMSARSKVSPH